MQRADLDLYTDYLLSTFGFATATGLSAMVEGAVSHDRITRFLSGQEFTSRDLWKHVKPEVRSIESSDGVLIFDDTIQEKAWTDENELMCWHYDHVNGRNVRGINLLNALYYSNGASIVKGRVKPGHCGGVKLDQLVAAKLLDLRGRRGSGA